MASRLDSSSQRQVDEAAVNKALYDLVEWTDLPAELKGMARKLGFNKSSWKRILLSEDRTALLQMQY